MKSAVAKLLLSDATVYDRKAADYAPGADPWENFRFSARVAAAICRGLPDDDPRRAAAVLIGVKVSRLMTVGLGRKASNETIIDTMRDLRVYVAILEAQHEEATRRSHRHDSHPPRAHARVRRVRKRRKRG